MPRRTAYVSVELPRSMTGQEIIGLVLSMQEIPRSMRFTQVPEGMGFLVGLNSPHGELNLCVAPDPRFGPFSVEQPYTAVAIGSYDWASLRQLKPVVVAGELDLHLEEVLLFAERLEAELSTNDTVLRTPEAWLDLLHPRIEIRDPDGWRAGADFEAPITKPDFKQRLSRCTLGERPRKAATQWVGVGV